nr:MAG TPA: hypothetical protein [Caudoviricetes sp.]
MSSPPIVAEQQSQRFLANHRQIVVYFLCEIVVRLLRKERCDSR